MITTLYEPFRHWSDGGSVYILSDLHFSDSDCKLMNPNWITPEEQLDIINGMVGKGDTFVCLGDVGDPKFVPMIKARKKILVLGNHDARGAYKDLFSEVYAGPLFISDKILLSHEPVYGLPWCLNIHGHDHNNMEAYIDGCKHINLAANVCGYTPINLRKMDEYNEDGYQVVQDYIDSLDEKQRKIFDSEINRNKGNIYCGDIIAKYEVAFPIWAFIEIVPFGRLVAFYGFCADRFSDKSMKDTFYRLLTCKEIRNASAHSNCILNNLKAKTAAHSTNVAVTSELMKIKGMNTNFRKNRMSNARIQQVVTLLYTHKDMVESEGIKRSESEDLKKIMERVDKNYDYYNTNPMIKGTFDFLKLVVDSWFKSE